MVLRFCFINVFLENTTKKYSESNATADNHTPTPSPLSYCSGMDFCLQWAELPEASLEQDRLLGELRLWGERPNAKEEAKL